MPILRYRQVPSREHKQRPTPQLGAFLCRHRSLYKKFGGFQYERLLQNATNLYLKIIEQIYFSMIPPYLKK